MGDGKTRCREAGDGPPLPCPATLKNKTTLKKRSPKAPRSLRREVAAIFLARPDTGFPRNLPLLAPLAGGFVGGRDGFTKIKGEEGRGGGL